MIDLLRYPFMQHALLAGSLTALGATLVGFFLINRGMTFACHALPNIGFAGAAGAVLLGFEPVLGLFAFILIAALVFAFLGGEHRERDIGIGVVMSLALGLGVFFLASYSGYAQRVYAILFGSILGISAKQVLASAILTLITLAAMTILFRPLLFYTVDPEQAAARGLPIAFLNVVFMVLVAVTVTTSVQVTGALLVFALMVAPPAIAMRLSRRPGAIVALALVLGQIIVIMSILMAGMSASWPVSFFVAALSFLGYAGLRTVQALGSTFGREGRTWKA